MSIVDRIKKKLPLIGGGAEPVRASSPSAHRPMPSHDSDEGEGESARGAKPAKEFIDEFVKGNKIAIFMKGSPSSPQCGFSANASSILRGYNKPIAHFDILSDPDVRSAVKEYSQWPTIPQIYINGEFIGGSDNLAQAHASGELKAMLDEAFAPAN
jgi:monothiol glutaredoxin